MYTKTANSTPRRMAITVSLIITSSFLVRTFLVETLSTYADCASRRKVVFGLSPGATIRPVSGRVAHYDVY